MLEAIVVIAVLGLVVTISVIAAYAAISRIRAKESRKAVNTTLDFLQRMAGITLDIVGSMSKLNNRTMENKYERKVNYYE